MENLKEHQKATTIEEQVANLKKLGLKIDDEDFAKTVLNDISYFRLIKAYSLTVKPKNQNYYEGTSFKEIVDLYRFNTKLRHIIFAQIEKIEVTMRCRVANYFSCQYGVLGYKEAGNFDDETYHNEFMEDIELEINRNSKAPFVKNFRGNYIGGDLPLYALTEVFSFGTLSKFYKNMTPKDKKYIAQTFGVGYTYLESWLESLAYVRNICAHYGRLYNAKFAKTPKMYGQYKEKNIKNNRLFGILLCMKHILKNDSQWWQFVNEIEALIESYENVDIRTMGFTPDWKELLEEIT